MAFWIEMRCEGRARNDDCPSNRDAGPIMDLFNDTHKDASAGLRSLAAEAKASGWRLTREGWLCPQCQELTHDDRG